MVTIAPEVNIQYAPVADKRLYWVKHWAIGDPGRDGRPEVVPLLPVKKSYFDFYWQNFFFDLTWNFWPEFDYDFAAKRWTSLNGDHLALMNRSGFPGEPPVANYITGEHVGSQYLPAYDKTRTMGGNVVAGVEDGDMLWVETLDGNAQPPPLQYVLDRPWLYFHCVLAFKNKVGLFPQGCDSDRGIWQKTVAPLVATTDVYLPMSAVVKLPLGSPIPDPYELNL